MSQSSPKFSSSPSGGNFHVVPGDGKSFLRSCHGTPFLFFFPLPQLVGWSCSSFPHHQRLWFFSSRFLCFRRAFIKIYANDDEFFRLRELLERCELNFQYSRAVYGCCVLSYHLLAQLVACRYAKSLCRVFSAIYCASSSKKCCCHQSVRRICVKNAKGDHICPHFLPPRKKKRRRRRNGMIIKQNVYDLDSLRLESSVAMCTARNEDCITRLWRSAPHVHMNPKKKKKKTEPSERTKIWTGVFHGNFKSSAQINNFALKAEWRREKKTETSRTRGKTFAKRRRASSCTRGGMKNSSRRDTTKREALCILYWEIYGLYYGSASETLCINKEKSTGSDDSRLHTLLASPKRAISRLIRSNTRKKNFFERLEKPFLCLIRSILLAQSNRSCFCHEIQLLLIKLRFWGFEKKKTFPPPTCVDFEWKASKRPAQPHMAPEIR